MPGLVNPPVFLLLCSLLEAPDPGRLREMLQDTRNPRDQSQAALLLVRDSSSAAEEIVRRGLRQTESPEAFLALATAVRMTRDLRFSEELLAALTAPATASRPMLRQAAAETLTATADGQLVQRIRKLLDDGQSEPNLRQTLLLILGRSGSQEAGPVLVKQLDADNEAVQRAAADALADLSGLSFGLDRTRWKAWWEHNKDLPRDRWLEQRLAFQSSRSRRLEGQLEQTRAQLVRLHQLLYARLPAADRVGYVQALADQEDPAIRLLAVHWGAELLVNQAAAARDGLAQRAIGEVLLRLSHDSRLEVQRLAVLALGRVTDQASFDRLRGLLGQGRAVVRAAAARALTQLSRGPADADARRKKVVPLLQKALDDPSLEVVIEVAEDLGVLGVPEAGPVLVGLLKHQAEHVRQTAVHALERVADPCVLDDLLKALGDSSVAVRFGLVGAIGHAAGDGRALTDSQREQLLTKLQALLLKDADAGVRSRAASVLGECGQPSVLSSLWQRMAAGEDTRVQEKAWASLVEIIARSGSADVLREWDGVLSKAGQGAKRLLLLDEVHTRWQSRADAKTRFLVTAPLLASAKLEQGKWQAVAPLLRELVSRADDAPTRETAVRGLLTASEQALQEGDFIQGRRFLEDARPFLPKTGKLQDDFARLEKKAG